MWLKESYYEKKNKDLNATNGKKVRVYIFKVSQF